MPIRLNFKERDAWTQIDGEPDDAFRAFVSYRGQLPPRDIRRVTIHGVALPVSRVGAWAQVWAWKARAAAYDAHFEKLAQQEREHATKSEAQRVAATHSEVLHQTIELLRREIQKMHAQAMASEHPTLRPNEVTKLLTQVVQLQRLVLGETTANIGTSKVDDLSPEDLAALDEIYTKAGLNT
jgi:hypothetical protein